MKKTHSFFVQFMIARTRTILTGFRDINDRPPLYADKCTASLRIIMAFAVISDPSSPYPPSPRFNALLVCRCIFDFLFSTRITDTVAWAADGVTMGDRDVVVAIAVIHQDERNARFFKTYPKSTFKFWILN